MSPPISRTNPDIGPADFEQSPEQISGGAGQNLENESGNKRESMTFTTRSGQTVDIGEFEFTPRAPTTRPPNQDTSALSALGGQNDTTGDPSGLSEPDLAEYDPLEDAPDALPTPKGNFHIGINTPFGSGQISHSVGDGDGHMKTSLKTGGPLGVEVDTDDGSSLTGKIPGGIDVSIDDKGKVSAEIDVDLPVGPFGGVKFGAGVTDPWNDSGDPKTATLKAGGRLGPPGFNVDFGSAVSEPLDDPWGEYSGEPVNRISPEPVNDPLEPFELFTAENAPPPGLSGPEVTGKLPERPAATPTAKPDIASMPDFSESQLIDFESISNTPNLGPQAEEEVYTVNKPVEPRRPAFKPDILDPPAPTESDKKTNGPIGPKPEQELDLPSGQRNLIDSACPKGCCLYIMCLS